MKEEKNIYYDITGAGKIRISESANWMTGDATGFSFGVEWGINGYAGGVLSVEDAEKLANHINLALRKHKLNKLNEI
jgi:precorrin-6B methylase 2